MRRLVIGLASVACALFVGTSVTAAKVERPAQAAAAPDAATVCKGKTLRFIGLAGEEGNKELKAWRTSIGLKLQVTNISNWGQLIGAIKVGQPFDLATFTYSQAQRMIATKIMQPLDVTSLPGWKDFAPALRNSRLIYGPDKKVYGVPLFWGDSPYVYVPSRVPHPPKSILDLTKPEWKGRFLVDDDPDILFNLIARAKGFKKSPDLTKAQLKTVQGVAQQIVSNAGAFAASYQDATDRMVAGDADLTVDGWEAQLTWAKAKGKKLAFAFFNEHKGGGWWDGLSIPSTAKNADCALAYINKMMEAKTNAVAATSLVSGAANLKAVPMIGKVAKIYDYGVVSKAAGPNDFISFSPPDTAAGGFTVEKDWQAAWAAIKAGK
jgi:spermidine/putrescine transport system substrate-binding protein